MSTRLSREEVLKKKAEDEARRAGTLPAEKDAQGRVINPHIPEFMKVAPWYMGNETVGLDHQRLPESQKYSSDIHAGWYERGRKAVTSTEGGVSSSKATCTNCGASTHIAKNCLEKPRKQNAVKTGSKLGPDDVSQPNLSLSYDGKRDTYNGFDVDAQMRALQRRSQIVPKADDIAPISSSSTSVAGQGKSSSADGTTGQQKKSDPMLPKASLRVRSDLAKYLRNLDPESAFYDPKTRSMRANPNPELPLDQLSFAGDNFVRNSGEAVELDKMEAFASQRSAQTSDASQALQANPTALALAKKEFEERKAKLAAERKKKMEEQYGTSTAAAKPAVQASSAYVEYAPDGKLLTGSIVVPVAMSKYEEDVFERNHTSVWGSYFEPFSMAWGYACCWQTVRSSYCTGESGKQAIMDSLERARPDLASNKGKDQQLEAYRSTTTISMPQTAAAVPPSVVSSAMYGEGSVEAKFDQNKLAEALKRIQPSASNKDNVKRSLSDSSSSSDWSTSSSESESDAKRRAKSSKRQSHSDELSSSSRDSSRRKKHRTSKKSKKSKKDKKRRKETRRERDKEKKIEPPKDDFGRDSREITPEDLEAHRLTRVLAGDPMANMLSKDGDDVAQL